MNCVQIPVPFEQHLALLLTDDWVIELAIGACNHQSHVVQSALHTEHCLQPLQPTADILTDHVSNEKRRQELELAHDLCHRLHIRKPERVPIFILKGWIYLLVLPNSGPDLSKKRPDHASGACKGQGTAGGPCKARRHDVDEDLHGRVVPVILAVAGRRRGRDLCLPVRQAEVIFKAIETHEPHDAIQDSRLHLGHVGYKLCGHICLGGPGSCCYALLNVSEVSQAS
mmetsp:Transcript_27604/g.51782  ORF Transcript_27604/g.51782 Transcript_27604/m.51782 type:complete len:227 (+) Transcript_27604:905-1585(+)